jgi:hypothetical protein
MVGVVFRTCLCLLIATAAFAADPRDPVARARHLYNQRQFEAAVAASDEARLNPDRADAADLIAARAYLERYRDSASSDDLTSARDRLRRVNPARFSPRERLEFIVGLGETLYLDGAPGAAAALFDSVLMSGGGDLLPEERERVLDWWASALDRDVRPRPDLDRQPVYQRIRDRMADELAQNPASATAAYWASAAARGQGDLQAAWDAAQAAWVRAPMTSDRGAELREDVDRLVERAIVPERARVLAQPPDVLRMEWERFKERWSR